MKGRFVTCLLEAPSGDLLAARTLRHLRALASHWRTAERGVRASHLSSWRSLSQLKPAVEGGREWGYLQHGVQERAILTQIGEGVGSHEATLLQVVRPPTTCFRVFFCDTEVLAALKYKPRVLETCKLLSPELSRPQTHPLFLLKPHQLLEDSEGGFNL